MSDVHGIVEVLDLILTVGADVQKALADGKVTVKDYALLADLWAPAKLALKDIRDVRPEIATLDTDGVKQVLGKVADVVEAWIGVFEAPKA